MIMQILELHHIETEALRMDDDSPELITQKAEKIRYRGLAY
jgi:hypothetical protein